MVGLEKVEVVVKVEDEEVGVEGMVVGGMRVGEMVEAEAEKEAEKEAEGEAGVYACVYCVMVAVEKNLEVVEVVVEVENILEIVELEMVIHRARGEAIGTMLRIFREFIGVNEILCVLFLIELRVSDLVTSFLLSGKT